MKRTRPIAFHEAAHAVCARSLGVRVGLVTIAPDLLEAGNAGEVRHDTCDDAKYAILCAAGAIAERRVTPLREHHQVFGAARGDLCVIQKLAAQRADPVAFSNTVHDGARQMVKAWWPAIERVAEALLRKRTLAGWEVDRLMGKADAALPPKSRTMRSYRTRGGATVKVKDSTLIAAPGGRFRARITTSQLDRDNEVLLPSGCDTTDFEKSGPICWNHDYNQIVGIPSKIIRTDSYIEAEGVFLKRPADWQGEWFPDYVKALVEQSHAMGKGVGISVGFIATGSRFPTPNDKALYGPGVRNIIERWKLLEFSFAPIQSNPGAMTLPGKGKLSAARIQAIAAEAVRKALRRRGLAVA